VTSTTLGTAAQHKKQKPPVHQCSILQQQQAAGQQAEARDPAAAREMREHAEPARRQPAIHSALANRMTHPTERGALHQQKEVVKGAG